MKFYDLHAETVENNIQQMAEFAEKLGYSGIAICNTFENIEKLKQLKEEISKVKSNIEIYLGVKIKAKDPQEMNEIVSKVREHVLIVIVAGGDYSINRAACENPRVDILAHPELKRIDNGLDEACLNSAAQNNVAIQVNLREIAITFRRPRSYILNNVATNIRISEKLRAPLIICSGAQSVWDMRDPRELVAIANVLGLELGKAFNCVTNVPQSIIENNKKILEGRKITEGVELVG
jgi:ribonuclease P/MRP protein subunit RPP1